MWGSQPWNQWALQPSMFNNVPHDEIDWAALAKQWIQMQQVPSSNEPVPAQPPAAPLPPQPPPPPPGEYGSEHVPPPLPPARLPMLSDPFRGPVPDVRPPGIMPEPGPPFGPREPGSYWRHEWEVSAAGDVDERVWVPPPPPDPAVPMLPNEKKTFDYGHVHDNPPLTMQTVDYNHVSDHFGYNPVYQPEDPYDQYWSQVAAAPVVPPSFLKKDRVTPYQGEEETAHIDAAKRKQLPAWIREGLEKMEQERLKRLEKERAEKEKSERAKRALQGSPKKGLLISGGYESSAISVPTKSKFDSDSENEEDMPGHIAPASQVDTEDVEIKHHKQMRFMSPVEDTRTEEEKQQELMLKVRRMLTEVLLEVTNAEMLAVAREVYQKALAKAPARPLASTPALRSIATGLGSLANYDSQSEASESGGEESSSSDEELQRRIEEKKQRFAAKERKILADIKAAEEERRLKQKQPSVGSATSPPPPVCEEAEDIDANSKFNPVISGADGRIAEENQPSNEYLLESKDPAKISQTPPHSIDFNSSLNLPDLNHENKTAVIGADANLEKEPRLSHKTKGHDKDSKSGSSSVSGSESDSSSSSLKSSGRKSSKKRAKGSSSKRTDRSSRKDKKHRSTSRERRHTSKRNGDNSSDSSHRNSKYSYHKSEKSHSKKYERDRSESSESPPHRGTKRHRSRERKESPGHRRHRSRSHERYSKRRKSRSSSRSRRDSSRSRRRDRDERKYKDYKHSESRSSSRTPPKRYKRVSRSVSSERGRHSKKSKVRTRNR